MSNKYEISVIMSVFNSENYLKEAVESILNQTLHNFEFIITDDASTDNSLNILEDYALKDPRIVVIKNKTNLGLTVNLNRMISITKGNYIARMDADDISLPNRLEIQKVFMEKHQDVDICGSYVRKFNRNKLFKTKFLPLFHPEIKASLLFENVIMHPTVIMRKSSILKYSFKYNEEFKIIQDYELWCKIIDDVKFMNLNKVLLYHRMTEDSVSKISNKNLTLRKQYYEKIIKPYLKKIGVELDDDNINKAMFFNLSDSRLNNLSEIKSVSDYIKKLIPANDLSDYIDKQIFKGIIGDYLFKLYFKHSCYGFGVAKLYYNNHVPTRNTKLYYKIKFLIKCALKR